MADTNYQALYRRYRSQRFSEVLGQDHVTRALRNAVRESRVGHAYLFSGPRGTGKTSTARILAKVLNCAAPEDGEPCGKCDNCVAVERGLVVDWLLEQDAASKSKVDDMRDLLDRVPLGTSGNRKVIILDEVHMLSQGAENALLKTLEEPPDHVVFVLATTDPQKVRETIRSRTQHFTFHLLPSEVVADHVRHVIEDAGLQMDDVEGAVAHVVRVGGGSARDTLSALDQVAALGSVVADGDQVEAIVDAVIARDAGAVLVAVADATATGRDPRGLGEAIIARLRDAFLAVMGAADDHVPVADRPRATHVGEQLGAAGLTRALDVLGEALTELSRKPDPRVVLEVALIRLVRPEADRSIDAVLQRLERLEQGRPPVVASGDGAPAAAPTPAAAPPPSEAGEPAEAPPPAPPASEAAPPPSAPSGPSDQGGPDGPASAARAVLAANRPRGGAKTKTPSPPPAPAATLEAPAVEPAKEPAPEPTPPPNPAPPAADGIAEPANLARVWPDVLAALPISIRSKWRGGEWTPPDAADVARFAVPNAWHQKACEEGRTEVERALAERIGSAVRVKVVAEGDQPPSGSAASGDDEPEILDAVDVAALPDANDVTTGGVDLLLREFGGELVEEDPK